MQPEHGGPELHLDDDDQSHLDLWTVPVDDLAEEVDRLVQLGARRAAWCYPDGADFVVLLDTEGNAFCVVDNSESSPDTAQTGVVVGHAQ